MVQLQGKTVPLAYLIMPTYVKLGDSEASMAAKLPEVFKHGGHAFVDDTIREEFSKPGSTITKDALLAFISEKRTGAESEEGTLGAWKPPSRPRGEAKWDIRIKYWNDLLAVSEIALPYCRTLECTHRHPCALPTALGRRR